MKLVTRPYCEQLKDWPATGQHVLAQFDDETTPEMSSFVAEQRGLIGEWKSGRLLTPAESVYVPDSVGLSSDATTPSQS